MPLPTGVLGRPHRLVFCHARLNDLGGRHGKRSNVHLHGRLHSLRPLQSKLTSKETTAETPQLFVNKKTLAAGCHFVKAKSHRKHILLPPSHSQCRPHLFRIGRFYEMVALAFDATLGFSSLLVVPNPRGIATAVGTPNVKFLKIICGNKTKWRKYRLHEYSRRWLCGGWLQDLNHQWKTCI